MDIAKQHKLFSQKRLQSYKNPKQHYENFLLISHLSFKIGLLEIITRNKIAALLDLEDNHFISTQTLGFWCSLMKCTKIHNKLIDLTHINFKDYSSFNKKDKMRNYQKVEIAYSLFRTIRNRAFHFENLFKQNTNGTPRLSTCLLFGQTKILVGIETHKIEKFLDDMLDCFDDEISKYVNSGYEMAVKHRRE
ncbi:ATPase [Helicobacter sp. MIT 11-5569]|uniref:ATPase n=1 Tax=Helicobacter sp. MIT 11-5569 TaxID=1548151 RepID=UPI001F323312|nr:ATPase [Helicobacter sp. MIT 11-5569]